MGNFDSTATYILENDAVQLRPIKMEDLEQLSIYSIYEPHLWDYSLTPANGVENLKKYLELALKGRTEKTAYPFVVFDKRHHKYVGSTRFYDIQEQHNTAQLGYTWYGSEFQGTGLNKNCKYLLLEFAFETMGWERVEFRADAKNLRSIAAMKSIGCTVEGILRSNCKSASGRRDSIVLSILKDEWYASVKNTLAETIKL
ncbi:MAG: GNAT family N-acetyltransferase [Altibacter sp.]|uniref:GNAT family N-acetyltransferase n=1 Tax=Altibacter sp. TaxID=2024823 RepID=UPI001D29FDD7|nr:GNAT family protein [Altibacter sp.]MBZ0327909.1 GNAT family N-acetyltransferase [Altibacter sp.]